MCSRCEFIPGPVSQYLGLFRCITFLIPTGQNHQNIAVVYYRTPVRPCEYMSIWRFLILCSGWFATTESTGNGRDAPRGIERSICIHITQDKTIKEHNSHNKRCRLPCVLCTERYGRFSCQGICCSSPREINILNAGEDLFYAYW